jgi:four helix bundle protein
MTVIKRFEDLIAWQEARKLSKEIHQLTASGEFSRDFGLRNQIREAAVSSMTNIAEGFDCESRVEFGRFLTIARRSTVEVQSLLYTALDNGYIDQTKLDTHYNQAGRTKSIIQSLKRSLNVPGKRE